MIGEVEKIRQSLADHHPLKNSRVHKRASVLIPLLESEGEIYVMLTRRSSEMRSPVSYTHLTLPTTPYV